MSVFPFDVSLIRADNHGPCNERTKKAIASTAFCSLFLVAYIIYDSLSRFNAPESLLASACRKCYKALSFQNLVLPFSK
jgi:hypothetical protein